MRRPASGNPKVSASPLMSWAAWKISSLAAPVNPACATLRRAWSSRSHSVSIQDENSVDSSASAASARATGSSSGTALPLPGLAIAFLSMFGGWITS